MSDSFYTLRRGSRLRHTGKSQSLKSSPNFSTSWCFAKKSPPTWRMTKKKKCPALTGAGAAACVLLNAPDGTRTGFSWDLMKECIASWYITLKRRKRRSLNSAKKKKDILPSANILNIGKCIKYFLLCDYLQSNIRSFSLFLGVFTHFHLEIFFLLSYWQIILLLSRNSNVKNICQ